MPVLGERGVLIQQGGDFRQPFRLSIWRCRYRVFSPYRAGAFLILAFMLHQRGVVIKILSLAMALTASAAFATAESSLKMGSSLKTRRVAVFLGEAGQVRQQVTAVAAMIVKKLDQRDIGGFGIAEAGIAGVVEDRILVFSQRASSALSFWPRRFCFFSCNSFTASIIISGFFMMASFTSSGSSLSGDEIGGTLPVPIAAGVMAGRRRPRRQGKSDRGAGKQQAKSV